MENVQKENDDHYSLCIINTCKINVNHITLYLFLNKLQGDYKNYSESTHTLYMPIFKYSHSNILGYCEAGEYSLRSMVVLSCWGTLQLPINIKPDRQLSFCCPGAHLISLQTTQISSGKIIFFLLLVRAHHSPDVTVLHPPLLLSTSEEQVIYI